VSIERAKNVLSFHPHHDVRTIVGNLITNMGKCSDWDNPKYYNISVFGQLGEDVAAAFAAEGDEVISLIHEDVEVSSKESVARSLDNIRPEIVVNTAAFHHVEKCESEPAGAFAANAMGARNVAQASRSLGATLFHISTDYVFDGLKQSPYTEQDPAMPLNVYGNSKLAGEYFVRAENPRHFVVRVS